MVTEPGKIPNKAKGKGKGKEKEEPRAFLIYSFIPNFVNSQVIIPFPSSFSLCRSSVHERHSLCYQHRFFFTPARSPLLGDKGLVTNLGRSRVERRIEWRRGRWRQLKNSRSLASGKWIGLIFSSSVVQ